jgi:hypothetical protein
VAVWFSHAIKTSVGPVTGCSNSDSSYIHGALLVLFLCVICLLFCLAATQEKNDEEAIALT